MGGVKDDVWEDRRQGDDCTMTEMEEAGLGTGWDQEFCFGHIKCQLFLRLPRGMLSGQLNV